jgi:hypothetical protein
VLPLATIVNLFKKSVGVSGTVTCTELDIPVENIVVKMFRDAALTQQAGLNAVTDEDEAFFIDFKNTGGVRTFYVLAGGGTSERLKMLR